jgi:citrate lyase subunit beta / citryl-CoA lyase
MRSMLFSPGNKPNLMAKALATRADAIIFDLEDSVPPEQKEIARAEIEKLLSGQHGKRIYIRTNPVDSPFILPDLLFVSRQPIAGLVIPKVSHPGDLEKVTWLIDQSSGKARTDLSIIAIVETPRGVANIKDIAATERLGAVMFGALDYVLELQGTREDDLALAFPRLAIAVACRANSIDPIDSVYPDYRDLDGLERECRRARSMGYSGKACIHPAQTDVINRAFSPAEAELAWAQRVVAAYEQATQDGTGAVSVDGSMVDEPVYKRARNILAHT